MIIRNARPDELERVRSHYEAWGYDAGAEPEDLILVAEHQGEFVGLVRRTFDLGTVLLRGMQVAPSERGHGIGKRLLEEFVDRLDGSECYCIPFAHLTHFYQRAGFELEDPGQAPSFLAERLERHRLQKLEVELMRRPPRTRNRVE